MFSMMAYEGEALRFSGIGFTPVSHPAKNGAGLMVVTLKTATEDIKEVVVNGYQKIEARMATASVYKLNAAEILQPGAASVDQMLQGKVPGLMIMNTSGSVNAAPTVRLRGTSTLWATLLRYG